MRRILPAGLAGLALALAACGGGSGDAASGDGARRETPRPTGSTAPAGPVTTAPVTTPAPSAAAVPATFRFSAPALGGGRVQGSDYAGTGVALWFWAPW